MHTFFSDPCLTAIPSRLNSPFFLSHTAVSSTDGDDDDDDDDNMPATSGAAEPLSLALQPLPTTVSTQVQRAILLRHYSCSGGVTVIPQ